MDENKTLEKEKKDPFGVISLILMGNISIIALVLFLSIPALLNLTYTKIVVPLLVAIIFLTYYASILIVLTHFAEKYYPSIKGFIKNHPKLIRRIGVFLGLILLFVILLRFLEVRETLKIYGVAFATWLLSFLVPKGKQV